MPQPRRLRSNKDCFGESKMRLLFFSNVISPSKGSMYRVKPEKFEKLLSVCSIMADDMRRLKQRVDRLPLEGLMKTCRVGSTLPLGSFVLFGSDYLHSLKIQFCLIVVNVL